MALRGGLNYRSGYSVTTCILFFFTFSLAGWVWEVILSLACEGVFVNRGILFGPWLPIYGAGGLLILLVLRPFRESPFALFWGAFFLCGILEYGTACFLEHFLHRRWWDYGGYLLNLQGRVCLEGLLAFGLSGICVTYYVAPLLDRLYRRCAPRVREKVCLALLILFGIDILYSAGHPNVGDGIAKECGDIILAVVAS